MEEVIIRIIMIVVTTFCFVAAIMPFIKKVAMQIGAVDIPRTRHIHTKPMPKMGGIAIFLGLIRVKTRSNACICVSDFISKSCL